MSCRAPVVQTLREGLGGARQLIVVEETLLENPFGAGFGQGPGHCEALRQQHQRAFIGDAPGRVPRQLRQRQYGEACQPEAREFLGLREAACLGQRDTGADVAQRGPDMEANAGAHHFALPWQFPEIPAAMDIGGYLRHGAANLAP